MMKPSEVIDQRYCKHPEDRVLIVDGEDGGRFQSKCFDCMKVFEVLGYHTMIEQEGDWWHCNDCHKSNRHIGMFTDQRCIPVEVEAL